jgi:DNA gyrase subunit A
MIITRQGQMIRMPVKGIGVMGRNTQGVRLVNLAPATTPDGQPDLLPDTVGGVTRVVSEDDEGSAAEAPADAGGAAPANEDVEDSPEA